MKRALITGASRGIGKATAEAFLAHGWEVVGTSTSGSGWQHERLSWVPLDLAHAPSIAQAAFAIGEQCPEGIDVLIDNAGIASRKPSPEGTIVIETLREILEVNLIGTIDFTERLAYAVPRGGHIIMLGSNLGSFSAPATSSSPSYSISKAALAMYARRLAARLEEKGVVVSIIDPGWVKTALGGREAPGEPHEAAAEIFALATTSYPTGRFWRHDAERPW